MEIKLWRLQKYVVTGNTSEARPRGPSGLLLVIEELVGLPNPVFALFIEVARCWKIHLNFKTVVVAGCLAPLAPAYLRGVAAQTHNPM